MNIVWITILATTIGVVTQASGMDKTSIRVSLSPLSDRAPADLPPSAMAYALPYEGNHIVIFYDRLQLKVKGETQISTLLGNVLAHEVTHILQGIHRQC
jgi:hypothetical protein